MGCSLLRLLLLASLLAASSGRADTIGPDLAFRRLLLNIGGARSEACLRFDKPLAAGSVRAYADHLHITPAIVPALRIDDADLCIGNLAFGVHYKITMLAGLTSRSGARLPSDTTLDVGLGDRPAMVAIAGAGSVLPRATANGIVVDTVNVDHVRLHVLRLSDQMLLQPNTGYVTSDLTSQSMGGYQLASLLRSTLNPVWHGEMDVAGKRNETVQTAFPMAGIVGVDRPGLFLVVAEDDAKAVPESSFEQATNDDAPGFRRRHRPRLHDNDDAAMDAFRQTEFAAHWVSVTDIGLTTFSGDDGLHVFARAYSSAQPIAGLRIVLQARGQDVLAEGVTDGTGAVAFPPGVLRGAGAEAPFALAAYAAANGAAAADFTTLRLDGPAFDFADRGVSGAPQPGPAQAFLATERGIYRPGETIDVTALLRDRQGAAIENQRLTLVLRRPDGVEARRVTLPETAGGGFVAPIRLTDTAAFGDWRVDALTDQTAPPVGSVHVSVQDFVPELLAVTLRPVSPTLAANAPATASLDGRFLYGAPAAGLHGEAELRIEREPTPVPAAPGFVFGLADEAVAIPPQSLPAPQADATGHATLAFTPSIPPGLTVPLRAVLRAGLFEPGGRIVEDQASLPIRPTRLLIGLHASSADAQDSGEATRGLPIDILTVGTDGKPTPIAGLHWAVIRENRIYDWFESNGTWSFHYHVVDEPVQNGAVATEAAGRGRITPKLDWGNYRVVVSDPASEAVTSTHVAIGWGAAAQDADTPDTLSVTARDAVLRPGETTLVHVAAPFAGVAELVVAGSRIFESRQISLPPGGIDLPITAQAEWGAGAYALVTAYRPLTAKARAHDPVRAVGLAWLAIDQAPHTLAVTLEAPAKVLPRRRLLVPIHVTGGTAGQVVRLSLAGVDEGILRLTRFTTPDPLAALFGKRQLGLDMRDDYGRLLDGDAPAGRLREGGDQGGEGGAGLPVVSSKIVSLFTGPVRLDAGGRGTAVLEVPDFEGQLRLMAVAWSAAAVGRAEASVVVRDPVFADVALPRFLAPDDTARIAVSLANTDGPDGGYHVALTAAGAIRLDGPADFAAALKRGARVQFAAGLVGTAQGIGTVTATLSRDGAAASLVRQWQIAVRPGHFPLTLSESELQKPGAPYTVDPSRLAGYVPGSASLSVGYSGFVGIDTVGLLQSLDGTPWGCSEQLASTAWPLIYFNDPGLLGRLPPPGGVKQRVQHAVDAILDREDAAGRFGLWRLNDGAASPWLDAYLVDFLMHARDAGFDVAANSLDRALAWLDEEQVQGFGDFSTYQGSIGETRAYALFVLARAGRANPDAIRRMHDDSVSELGDTNGGDRLRLVFWGDADSQASLAGPLSAGHLAAALSLTGDTDGSHQMFEAAVNNLGAVRVGRGSWFNFAYYTYVRDLAGLVALAAEAGNDPLAQRLAGRFGLLTLTPPLLDTQEKAALLAAAHALNRDEPGRGLALNGASLPGPLHLPVAFSPDVAQLAHGYTLTNVGRTGLWRTLTVTGAPLEARPALAAGYQLDRAAYRLDGTPLDTAKLHQNDRFVIVLHGSADDDDDHRSMLVDMLPAGWEIDSPVRSPDEFHFLGELTRPRAIEARDDRLVAAFDLGADLDPPKYTEVDDDHVTPPTPLHAGEFRIAYIVRVVTPGHFGRPEAVVQDMYRPALTARTASGTTDIAVLP